MLITYSVLMTCHNMYLSSILIIYFVILNIIFISLSLVYVINIPSFGGARGGFCLSFTSSLTLRAVLVPTGY